MTSRSDRVNQEAADWVVRLGEPETDRRNSKEQFLHWLTLSPEHKKAFTQTMDVSCALGNLDRSRRIDVQELIRRGSPKVIQLSPAVSPLVADRVRSLAHWLRLGLRAVTRDQAAPIRIIEIGRHSADVPEPGDADRIL